MVLYNNISEVTIISIPQSYGQKKSGVAKGPEYLLKAGLKQEIESLNLKVSHEEHVLPKEEKGRSNVDICGELCSRVADAVEAHSKKNRFCLNIGGDHSIATGTISGILRTYPNLCILWVDAHTDINTIESSESGSVHGMPVSFFINDAEIENSPKFPKAYSWCKNKLSSNSRLAYIGIRQVDEGEIQIIKKHNIPVFDMVKIDKLSVSKCLEQALKLIDPEGSRPIHVSFDVDSLDPSVMPSTGTPVYGGLTMREMLQISETLYKTGRLVSLDVAEVNPEASLPADAIKTASNTLAVIRSFLGEPRPSFD